MSPWMRYLLWPLIRGERLKFEVRNPNGEVRTRLFFIRTSNFELRTSISGGEVGQ
jgi:hypothetical protein